MAGASLEAVRRIPDKPVHVVEGDLDVILSSVGVRGPDAHALIRAYESALSEWFQVPHAVSVSSGAAALSTAFAVLNIGEGDEVILPPTCPLCTVYPILALGAVPRFCDTEAGGFGLSIEDVHALAGPRTRAIVEVPMWGYPTDLPVLEEVARELGIPLVLDLAHAHGSRLHGRDLAQYGTASCFSTHDRKPLSTGEGGFLLFHDPELAEAARRYSRYGYLDGVHFGVNLKLSPVQAALGRHRLGALSDQIALRRRNADRIRSALDRGPLEELLIPPDAQPNYYAMLLRLPPASAGRIIDDLDSRGVPSDVKRYGCKPLYHFPICEPYRRHCGNAERLLGSVTTIPTHHSLTEDDVDYIASTVRSVRTAHE
jgi:perosamine synthetase